MIGQETHDVQRKILAILKILNDSSESLGGSVISHRLNEQGIGLCERAVRYHLKIMDERGLTRIVGRRNGREITPLGLEELRNALVFDKIGRLTGRIEHLSYLTTFDMESREGDIPVDVSIINREDLNAVMKTVGAVCEAGLSISNMMAKASAGERLGELVIPEGKIGLATVSGVLINGLLLKCGIPSESRFVGLVQMHNFKPCYFEEFINYHSSTLDPLEMFISSRMTSVNEAVKKGEGKVLASFLEIPLLAKQAAVAVLQELKTLNLCQFYMTGNAITPLCEVTVNQNKTGILLYSGLNPVAAAAEQGISITSRAMGGVMDIRKLRSLQSA